MDYKQKVLSLEGEQVTLTVKVAGSPTPTITWLFNGKKVKDDYSTEVGKDGSLTLTCVELKHAGTYTFSVSNSVGSVEGCTKLVVHTEDEDCTSAPKVESNPVAKETFGEYVSGLHTHNNTAFFSQYQVINLAPPHIATHNSELSSAIDLALRGGRPSGDHRHCLIKQAPESIQKHHSL